MLLAFCCLFLCLSCQQQAIFDQYQSIEHGIWNKDKVYYFTFDIADTEISYNMFLEIRNSNIYPYQNLWLFCSEELPFGPLKRDTIELTLADEYGKWHGNGISLYQSSFMIRESYHFPLAGQYTFAFRQGMRNDNLPGIQEIGFRIEESQRSLRDASSLKKTNNKIVKPHSEDPP